MNTRALALKVSNDIAEGIDNMESRSDLRRVVKWWADEAMRLNAEITALKSEILLKKSGDLLRSAPTQSFPAR